MAYDPKCYELAHYFLCDDDTAAPEERIDALAQAIQYVCEDHCRPMEDGDASALAAGVESAIKNHGYVLADFEP